MKKILLTVLMTVIAVSVYAVPARPGKFRVTQPDGSVIWLERHGDENCCWTTDTDGNFMDQDASGFWRRAPRKPHKVSRLSPAAKAKWSSYETAPETNFGDRRILAILVEFSDTTFTIDNPREKFHALLNEKGYSYNGAYGSVKDYYEYNSLGQYRPTFDVYGPVRVSQPQAYYGSRSGLSGSVCLKEACAILDEQTDVNFADYDNDHDGKVEMILFYYAGHNPAEGGTMDAIWPHAGSASGTFDDVSLGRFFCTSEFKNESGHVMCGIGTTCHEFAHSLGLPDFYDVDYEENGKNEDPLGYYSLMDAAAYCDGGRRPANLTAVERNMLGWMPDFPVLEESGHYSLDPVTRNKAFTHKGKTPGEYYVYEYRTREGWDEFISDSGLVVYHIDKSDNIVPGSGVSAARLWESTNKINAYGGHPCIRVIPSGNGSIAFPGKRGSDYYSPCDWSGDAAGFRFYGIRDTGSAAEFDLEVFSEGGNIWGYVKDAFDTPIEGATVRISRGIHPFMAAPSSLSTDIVSLTDAEGRFSFALPEGFTEKAVIQVSAQGYSSVGEILDSESNNFMEFRMYPVMEEGGEYFHFDPDKTLYRFRFKTKTSVAASMRLSEQDIAELGLAGGKVKMVSFRSPSKNHGKAYAIVSYGNTPVLQKDITDQFDPDRDLSISLVEDDITIPSKGDLFVGYALEDFPSDEYAIYAFGLYDEDTGANISDFKLGSDYSWYSLKSSAGYCMPYVRAVLTKPVVPALAQTGVSAFSRDGASLKEGSRFIPSLETAAGRPVSSVSWYYDGEPVAEEPRTLTKGAHTWKAVILYCDGTKETIFFDFDV